MLSDLLKDKTTKKNIIFATSDYDDEKLGINEKSEITVDILSRSDLSLIQPRICKSFEEQTERTRKKAEVFTPSWICNKMNNQFDIEWFGREGVFNKTENQDWEVTSELVYFENSDDWQKYIKTTCLEIACGEAPFIVSRYDVSSGDMIPINRRIGILDRKLRVVSENTDNEADWLNWAFSSYKAVYGYELQGDNLLIARINLLLTFVEYMKDKWNRDPKNEELREIVDIITWNFWQMDGITETIPFKKPCENQGQLLLFGVEKKDDEVDCVIFDWENNKEIKYRDLKK